MRGGLLLAAYFVTDHVSDDEREQPSQSGEEEPAQHIQTELRAEQLVEHDERVDAKFHSPDGWR